MKVCKVNRRVAAVMAVVAPLLASGLIASAQSTSSATTKTHRLAIHVDDNDPAKMNLALNNAQNVSAYYSEKGEEVTIEIVAYGPGLHMLRADTSPKKVQARLKSFSESMPNVSFAACENTREKMAQAEGKKRADIPLVKNAKSVPSGVVRLMELQEQGWSYLRP
jgi:intracellular sulfur oxidation DsrE/DsrF family protein